MTTEDLAEFSGLNPETVEDLEEAAVQGSIEADETSDNCSGS